MKRWDALNVGHLSRFEKFRPVVDMFEDEKEVVFTAELPGMKKEDLTLNISERGLNLGVQHREKTESEAKAKGWYEHSASSRFEGFSQYSSFPCLVDPTKAVATFKNGVLEIRVPKQCVDRGGKCVKIK